MINGYIILIIVKRLLCITIHIEYLGGYQEIKLTAAKTNQENHVQETNC